MNREHHEASQGDADCGKPGEQERTGGAEAAGCCGPEMMEMMKDCPCGSFFKKHRLAAFAMLSLVILMFLISQVGGILGIIAFVRTL